MLVNSSVDSPVILTFAVFTVTRAVLLLPLFILVLHLGHQRWRRRSFVTSSHADFFTFHQAAMELIWVSGAGLYFCGVHSDLEEMRILGFCMTAIVFSGPVLFQILTCVESYLAVVHPVTYLWLGRSGGVRIRNMGTGCVWLLSFGWMGVIILYMPEPPLFLFFPFMGLALIVVSFFSLSVLCVLIRPGPGEVGRKKDRVDQSKQRAFYTIVVILGVLWLWFVGFLVCLALNSSPLLNRAEKHLLMVGSAWFSLPGSFVLPLLFLHRAGKLSFGSYNSEQR